MGAKQSSLDSVLLPYRRSTENGVQGTQCVALIFGLHFSTSSGGFDAWGRFRIIGLVASFEETARPQVSSCVYPVYSSMHEVHPRANLGMELLFEGLSLW